MKFRGIELTEFTSDKPVVFDPPRSMLVWDDGNETCRPALVCAYLPHCTNPVIENYYFWRHCADIPETVPCRYCSPRISDTTELKTFNYCPICGRKLGKENN